MALSDVTRRDPCNPRHWIGLRADDATLLAVWLAGLAVAVDELHTSVPVGCVPPLAEADRVSRVGAGYQASCAWRVDAAVRFGADWWVLECKPSALYGVIGQVLFYRHWWRRNVDYPAVQRWVILTDMVEPDIVPVCAEYGIDVIEVGEVLEFPRRRRGLRPPIRA